MKLREVQAKRIFEEHGIRVPRGGLARTPLEAEEVADALGGPVVLKPQLGVKGRGKVGGIGFAATPAEARAEASRLLGAEVHGEEVRLLLVEERVELTEELYLAVAVDRARRCPVLMACRSGGVDIEEVARTRPDALVRVAGSVRRPPSADELKPVADALGPGAADMAAILYQIFLDTDAETVEINPVARTSGGLVALDAVLNVNEASVYRHADLLELRQDLPPEDPLVEEAASKAWTYIDLGGEIAILSSGAGLTMTIVDLLARAGGSAANFLDTAQINDQGIYEAFDLLSRARPVKAWLVNIFAGLNRCDLLAEGICRYVAEHSLGAPLVIRMVGNQEEAGHKILAEAGIEVVTGLEEAVERVVALQGGAK